MKKGGTEVREGLVFGISGGAGLKKLFTVLQRGKKVVFLSFSFYATKTYNLQIQESQV